MAELLGAAPAPCPFCEILHHRAPAEVVYQDGSVLGIVPLNPVVEGHVIFLPVTHVEDATAKPVITGIVAKAASVYARSVGDCNIITSVGEAATQTVRHLHVHVVPRREGDGLHLPWTGQEKP